MATRAPVRSLVRFSVTPRFEIFYALRTLGENTEFAAQCRHETERLLPHALKRHIENVAPRPIMWALLADSLRDAKPEPTFPEIRDAIESLGNAAFQQAILGGVFRGDGTVEALLADRTSLAGAAASEAESGNALVTVMGLHPFSESSPSACAFMRIITEPAAYRSDMLNVLDQFWTSAFKETWEGLERLMVAHASSMRAVLEGSSLGVFAGEVGLPVTFDDRKQVVASPRGSTTFAYRTLTEIHVIPSAFNDKRIWGAYRDADGSVRLYLPVFDPALLHERVGQAFAAHSDPELGFRALGDTTRYAMAFLLAESPKTSVELARVFGVSKATISHHVHLLRSAGLLQERTTDKGVELTLDRKAVERISTAAAAQMFSGGKLPELRRSRHHEKAQLEKSEKKRVGKPPSGAAE